MQLADKKIFVAGHNGMVGSALLRRLANENCVLLTEGRSSLDLTVQADVSRWFESKRPQIVLLAAAKVGGILANSRFPADFLYENLIMEANVIHAAHTFGVEKLVFLGSTCIYPKHSPQPIPESALMTGPLEPTNEWYAIAKIAGLKLCQAYSAQYNNNFISVQPTNLYGPGDNYDLESSHVIPALLRKFHESRVNSNKNVVVWGTGKPLREFLYVDDLADAIVHLLKHYDSSEPVNIGSGVEVSIAELARKIAEVTGFEGEIVFDHTKPDGTPRKLSDCQTLLNTGWEPKTPLMAGLHKAYNCFLRE